MSSANLVSKFGPVEQQGAENSCVAHATTSAIEAILGVSDLSRQFVYYNARLYASATASDAGCTMRNAVRGIARFGAPDESLWPYSSPVTYAPPASVYAAALPLTKRIKAYSAVTSLTAMRAAMDQGLPVAFSFNVPDTFVSGTKYDGFLPLPTSSTTWLGQHAVVTAGYDDTSGLVLVRNSFGPTWGSQGYFTMPFGWFTTFGQNVFDAWTFIPA